MLNIRWYGRGGQGAFTAAKLLGRIITVYQGSYALAYPSFGPERRGAPVWSFTIIDDKKIIDRSQSKECDYLIILDETLVDDNVFDYLGEDGVVIINTSKPGKYQSAAKKVIELDATKMAIEILERPITNAAMVGAFAAVSGMVDIDNAFAALQEMFPPKLYEKNKTLLTMAYEAVKGDGECE